ncbi:MAG: fused MFS/spermidine synthase [Bacteroidetes bacterium]|nr:fused MFS/spermidine synthase [Bacteroidota bacterium]
MTNTPSQTNKPEKLKTILSIFFILSGMTGLIYQVVWFKYLALFLGNTTYAQMIVLATFLGGLALGNYFIGRKVDKFSNPLKVYAILELIIGVYCSLYPMMNLFLGGIYTDMMISIGFDSNLLFYNAFRFFLSACLILLPTILMGGTLPALTKFFVEKLNDVRKETATLYFLNSFGAVVGVYFVGFVLIENFGFDITIYIAAFINISIGLISLNLSSSTSNKDEYQSIEEEPIQGEREIFSKTMILISIIVAGISGMAALLYEMVWVRVLITIFGSSTYSFSIMLMSFISGITIGSLIVTSDRFKKFDKIKLIIICQFAIATSTMLVLPIYERLPYYFWIISSLFVKSESTFGIFLSIEFFICFLLIVIPTIFMGMTLPLVVEIVSSASKRVGYSVGTVFSVNTAGTVIGVLLTGLVFIPMLGIKNTFEVGILMNLLAAIILIVFYQNFRVRNKLTVLISTVIIAALYFILNPQWNVNLMLSGVFKRYHDTPQKSFSEFKKFLEQKEVLFYKEGLNANVGVVQEAGENSNRVLIINGKPDASDITDMPTQVLLGQIPLMLHPDPKNVFVVGFGSGVTIASALTHDVKKVVCAEISSEVIGASYLFEDVNDNCLSDPRLKVFVEDAQTILKLSKEKYDVIISEPSNPWISGIGNLFSKEYFMNCKEKLNENGLMVQWFHIYEMEDEILKLVMNTFNEVFPFAEIWTSTFGDIIIVGSEKMMKADFSMLNQKFNKEKVRKDFQKIKMENLLTFLSCQTISPEGFYALSNSKNINSQFKPLLEFQAPRSFFIGKTSMLVYNNDERFDTLSNLYLKDFVKTQRVDNNEILSAAKYHFSKSQNYRLAYAYSKYVRELNPKSFEANVLFLEAKEKLSMNDAVRSELESLLKTFPDSSTLLNRYGNILLNENLNATNSIHVFELAEAEKIFLKAVRKDTLSQVRLYIQLASAFLQNSELNKAIEYCEKAESILKDRRDLLHLIPLSDFYYTYSSVSMYLNNYEKVIEYFLQFINTNPNHPRKEFLKRKLDWRLKIQNQETKAIIIK